VRLQERLRPFLWAALAAGGALAPLLPPLLGGRTLAWRDSGTLHQPLRPLVVEALLSLRLPLWNPHEGTGMPLFAQILHGVLHPVSLLGALVAPGAGVDLLIAAHVVLAALGAAACARTLGASHAAAAVAGLGYGLSGWVLGMASNLTFLAAAATAPWTVAALRAAGAGARLGPAAAAVATAALLLAGDPQWGLVAALLGGALALDAGGGRGLGRAGLGLGVGLALAGVQLVPSWAFLGDTVRATGLADVPRSQWSLVPWRLLELVAPGFFGGRPGSAAAPVFVSLGGPSIWPLPFAPSVFVGAPLLLLAAAGLGGRTGKVLGGAAALSLWLALGDRLGAGPLLQGVPVWGSFRYAEKLVGPLTLVVALAAARGAGRIAASPPRWLLPATGAALAMSLVAAIGCAGGTAESSLAAGGAAEAAGLARRHLGEGLWHAVAALALLAPVLAAALRRPALRPWAPAALAAIAFAGGAAAAPFALHAGDPAAREAPLLRLLPAAPPGPRVAAPLRGFTGREGPPGLDPIDRQDAVQARMGVPPFGVPSRVDSVEVYTGLPPRRLWTLWGKLGLSRFWTMRRYGLTHVVLREPGSPAEAALASEAVAGGEPVLADPLFGITAWAVPHRPWALFATRARAAASPGEALAAVVAQQRRGGAEEVIVESADPLATSAGRVLEVVRGAESLRITAEAEGDGLLVVNDAFWPGWVATLDGRPAPVLAADYLVRAVRFPAGRHVLEMRYRPAEVGWGALLSSAGLLALAFLVARPPRRRPGAP
jgi:hypothetical protein